MRAHEKKKLHKRANRAMAKAGMINTYDGTFRLAHHVTPDSQMKSDYFAGYGFGGSKKKKG